MVYDEGFEVRVGPRRYFGFFKYDRKAAKDCPKQVNGDNEDAFGSTKCYVTDPSKVRLGWVVQASKKGQRLTHNWGCFYAEKVDARALQAVVMESATYRLPHLPLRLHSASWRHGSPSWTATSHPQFTDASPAELALYKGQMGYRKLHPLKDYALPSFLQADNTRCMHAKPALHQEDTYFLSFQLPSWTATHAEQQLQHITAPSQTLTTSRENGNCGSCYAISSAYALQKRFEILFNKLFPKSNLTLFESPLSAQSIVSCSPYNQGCSGGYPFLVGKHAKEFGFGTQACQEYQASDDPSVAPCLMNVGSFTRTPAKSKPHCGPEDRWYAKEYNYVGGFYEGCSEERMMQEIFHHGPVVVALDAPDALFLYHRGLFDAKPPDHGKICDVPRQDFNGWEYTNHAVVIVGWGEDPPLAAGEEPQKYWLVRNTWGKNWGNQGYMKMLRGRNVAGIESQAVFLDPDLGRGRAAALIQALQRK